MPRHKKPKIDDATLRMAIIGYQRRCDELLAKIAAIKAQLGQHGSGRARKAADAAHSALRHRKPLSAAARARISAAQKARWAAYKKGAGRPNSSGR